MGQKLLTIAIPTYNRVANLELLLRCLQTEVNSLQDQVQVMVSDNASTDATPLVLARLQADWPALIVHRNAQNVGAEGNFCELLDRVESQYFWLIGDDDLPRAGCIRAIVDLLDSSNPDLVYLPSLWLADVAAGHPSGPIGPLQYTSETAETFASNVNSWLTFISGNIVRLELYEKHFDGAFARRFGGSSLLQLAWVLKVLQHGSRFLRVSTECVLATAGNTGGYSVLTVFGANFPRVVRDLLPDHPRLVSAIMRRHVIDYLPGLIWQVRFANIGQFMPEDSRAAVRKQLGAHWVFWAFLWPIMTLPRATALPFYAVARLLSRLTRKT